MQTGPIPNLYPAASFLTGEDFQICTRVPCSHSSGGSVWKRKCFLEFQAMAMKKTYPFGFCTYFQAFLPCLPDHNSP